MITGDVLSNLLNDIKFQEKPEFIHPDNMKEHIDRLSQLNGIKSHIIGNSEEGRPLYALEIGTGEKVIFATGAPHANEPAGTVTLINLSGEISELQEKGFCKDYKFYFIPQLDPDGTVINWGWMKEKFSLKNFSRYSYCKVFPDIENGIPVEKEVKPARVEIEAFKNFIDKIGRVDYYVTLHSTPRTGGAHFILDVSEMEYAIPVINFLTDVCKNSGLEMYNIDPYNESGYDFIAPGFVRAARLEEKKKRYEKQPEVLKKLHISTHEYAIEERGAKLAVISELPYVIDDDLIETEDTKISLYDFKAEYIRQCKKSIKKKIWDEFKSFPVTRENKIWIEWHEFGLERLDMIIEFMEKSLDKYKGRFAKTHDLIELTRRKYLSQYSDGLMGTQRLAGLNTGEAKTLYEKYEKTFEDGWREYEKRLSVRLFPLSEQVKIQMALIMSGLLII